MPKKKKDNRWDDLGGGAAFIVPLDLIRHPNWARLSPAAVKLVLDLGTQYTGFNNGYLCPSFSLMRHRGWKSQETLSWALKEIEHYRIVERTQQGGRNRPNLLAFTWRRVDEKEGRPLDASPAIRPTNQWKDEQPDFVRSEPARKPRRKPRVLKAAA